MRIYAPVKDFNGLRNGVRFINGVGETDDPRLIGWFGTHGYTLEECEKCEKVDENSLEKCEKVTEQSEQPDFESMTPNELREWMKTNGYGSQIKNIRNKEKLLQLIKK